MGVRRTARPREGAQIPHSTKGAVGVRDQDHPHGICRRDEPAGARPSWSPGATHAKPTQMARVRRAAAALWAANIWAAKDLWLRPKVQIRILSGVKIASCQCACPRDRLGVHNMTPTFVWKRDIDLTLKPIIKKWRTVEVDCEGQRHMQLEYRSEINWKMFLVIMFTYDNRWISLSSCVYAHFRQWIIVRFLQCSSRSLRIIFL